MPIWIRLVVLMLFSTFHFSGFAAKAIPEVSEWYSGTPKSGVVLDVSLFVSSTCPHCHKAEAFLKAFSAETPWVHLKTYVINNDKSALNEFARQLHQFHAYDFAVPTITFCGSRWIGFAESDTTGKLLSKALTFCHDRIVKEGDLSDVTQNTLKQWSGIEGTNVKFKNETGQSVLPRLIISALIESVTPCSLFCSILLFSVLWIFPESRRQRFYAGLLFIVMLSVMHSWQFMFTDAYQAFRLNLRVMSVLTAVMLLSHVVRWIRGNPQSLAWVFPLIILSVSTVYAYQQTCDFNIGIVFQQWLTMQTMTTSAYYFCQMTYLLFYLAPAFLVWIFYLIFHVHPRNALPIAAHVLFGLIAVILLLYPSAMSSRMISALSFAAAFFVSWYYLRTRR